MERHYPAKLREMAESCYGCANCESYCPFFPKVFRLLDEEQYGKEGLIEAQYESLLDLCYDCKLCKTACPFKYDLPALVQEAKAEVMRTTASPSWIKTIFRRVDRVEALLHWFAPIVNLAAGIRPLRVFLERAAGIHRERFLPRFYFLTFRMRAALWPILGPALGEDRGEAGSAETCWKKGPPVVRDRRRPPEAAVLRSSPRFRGVPGRRAGEYGLQPRGLAEIPRRGI
ncbi:MAG: 4Fe-4S dicluster domain-containing protein [Nitrospirae bacterium]|nr:4Fe-4S dicluster domain-containing protein [Nitrospirota bacterium]